MRKVLILFIILFEVGVVCGQEKSTIPIYLDSKQPVEKRVADLMSRMTLEEKVAQMCQFVGPEHIRKAERLIPAKELKEHQDMGFYPGLSASDVEEMTKQGLIGSFLHVITAKETNYLQSLALQSRLKIPLLIGIDAIHGNGLYNGATIYPTCIGQASTFDENLVEKASRETALEMRAAGMHWAFTPNVEVTRDPRWGRVGETFGEDPYLVSKMGAATVKGLQSNDYAGYNNVIACAKHFIGGGQPENGINAAPCDISERTLWEVFMPSFKACLDAGAYTFMQAHNELNGIPCHASKYLMTDVLRNKWNFNGFVVSDWMDIERLQDYHGIVPTVKDACTLSVESGMDMHMHGPGFAESIIASVKEGKLTEERIDASVGKILEAKFKLGLFENPYIDESKVSSVVFAPEHQQTALEMARKSIVLLKNEKLLPIDRSKYKKIFVTGPNADNQTILGDWTFQQPDDNIVTIVEGLKKVSPNTTFDYYPVSENFRKMTYAQIAEAQKKAKSCDLAVVVVGENSIRYKKAEKTCGENSDRYDINLAGLQEQLVEAIHATGVPTVVILVNGRPLSTEWIADSIPAIVEAWEPGCFGGQAVAEILFGKVNPEGKLPITIPRHSGQIHTYYSHKFTAKWFNYATGKSSPLYEFGYGLSYTDFNISPVTLSSKEMKSGEKLKATIDIVNTGKMAGSEVVQLYLRDCVASVTRPLKELKSYQKVYLKPGEKKTVTFEISEKDLMFYDINMNYTTEKGDFEIMIGNSSRDSDLQRAIFKLI